MAIWQFQCNIIPSIKRNLTLSYNEMISWENIAQPTGNINFLKQEKSWSPSIVQYGKIDGTCIEFIYGKASLDEIKCRLDLRTLTKDELIQIIEYVQSIDACFLVEDKVYPPKTEIMLEVMMQSNAYQYCKCPLEYIKSLSSVKRQE